MDTFKRLTFWLLEGTRGGPTRRELLSLLAAKPMNLHQLARAASRDYKTVEHHIRLLEENGLVEVVGNGYGKVYFVAESVLREYVPSAGGGGKDGTKNKKR